MFEIDKGVKAPPQWRVDAKYPFEKMKKGDSFFATKDLEKAIRSNASQASKKLCMRFTVRQVEGGVRCWRIE